MKAPRFWGINPPSPLARALQPLGVLYGAATLSRMARPGAPVAAPVFCVGNFVAGGAGKTPAAIAIARLLADMGEKPAFLSRGYGGAAREEPIAVDPKRHKTEEVGDEPLLLAAVAPCFVSRDRPRAARAAIAAGASALVMDDGLQNPSLAKDVNFAVVDGVFGFGNGLCFPAGPLRAPIAAQLPYVSLSIVVENGSAVGVMAALAGKPCVAARLVPDEAAAAHLRGRDVLAFAGIGRPEKFFATLKALGARVAATRSFADHHRYATRELDALFAEAARRGLIAVTTEKDFVRLPPRYAEEAVALPVVLRFADDAMVKGLLAAALARRRGPLSPHSGERYGEGLGE